MHEYAMQHAACTCNVQRSLGIGTIHSVLELGSAPLLSYREIVDDRIHQTFDYEKYMSWNLM